MPIFLELKSCLLRPKIQKLTKKSESQLSEWLENIFLLTDHVNGSMHIRGICRDPNDEIYISAAIECAAAYLVSGDKDLLVLEAVEQTPIVDPRTFWNALQGN